jgi:glutathione S-transferase
LGRYLPHLDWCVSGERGTVAGVAEFLVMNPNGTGPVLRDEGSEPVWETGTILRYLATRYGTDSFWPAFREHVMVSYEELRVSD